MKTARQVKDLIRNLSRKTGVDPQVLIRQYMMDHLLENRSISIYSYNLETVLAEKLETILSRSIANTRMRDFYDIHILISNKQNMVRVS